MPTDNANYTVKACCWDDAVAIFNAICRKNTFWIYRGQGDTSWRLQTTFERECENHKLDPYFNNTCESNIITAFQRQSRQYFQNLPAKDEYVDWLALIQHYGGPTRLLDFTYSFYVAAFFALQNATSDAAVWAVNANSLIRVDKTIRKQLVSTPCIGYREALSRYVVLANNLMKEGQQFNEKDRKQSIYPVEPFFQEQRLAIQQGLFLFPTDIETSFENNLSHAFGAESDEVFNNERLEEVEPDFLNTDKGNITLLKIVLSGDMRYEAVNHLQQMNISDATLFPGLDGFARSLKTHFYEMKWEITKPRN